MTARKLALWQAWEAYAAHSIESMAQINLQCGQKVLPLPEENGKPGKGRASGHLGTVAEARWASMVLSAIAFDALSILFFSVCDTLCITATNA